MYLLKYEKKPHNIYKKLSKKCKNRLAKKNIISIIKLLKVNNKNSFKKGKRTMRKLLKRITTAVATAAIATAMCFSALAADTYHVAGAEGLTGVNWDPAENQMTANGDGTFTKVFENVAKGTYEFKIVTNGAWDNGEYNLEGDASSGGANAEVTVDADGSTVTVTFDGEKASVDVKAGGAAPAPEGDEETPAPEGDEETPAPEGKGDTAPQTGDATPYAAAVIAMAALGCAVIVMNAKKANR